MKLIVIKNNLKDILGINERAVSEHQNLPILKNVSVEAKGNTITLTSTNLEIAIQTTLLGKIVEEGKITVPLRTLLGVIANVPSDRLTLEQSKNGLEIKTDNYRAAIQGISAEEFPIIPKIKNTEHYIEIQTTAFKDALSQVIVASQHSDIRPEFNSVLFDFSLDLIKLTATDSFRLAEKSIYEKQFKSTHKEGFKILIPLKTCHELMKILKDEEILKIYHDEHQILFKTNTSDLISRLINGNFPDYQAIIPQKFSAEVILERQEFLNAIKLASIFGDRSNEIKIRISENKKALEVFSADQAIGENSYLIPAKIKGEVKECGFNWRYLSDGLKAFRAEEIFFGINDENKPALIKLNREASYFYIVMPILKA